MGTRGARAAVVLGWVVAGTGSVPALAQNPEGVTRPGTSPTAWPRATGTDTSSQPQSSPPAATNESAHRQRNYKAEPLNLHRSVSNGSGVVELARARMKRGEYAGALDAFDEAMRSPSPEPSLLRDRGKCHDALHQPYPAIDDFRAYLTALPDAPDADAISERLEALEKHLRESEKPVQASDAGAPDHAKVRAMGGEASGSAWSSVSDDSATVEKKTDPPSGSLRRGTGMSFGPFLSIHKWQTSGLSFDDAQTWAESIGGVFRYSFGDTTALLIEAGYEHFNSTTVVTIQGLTTQVAIEFRFPLDPAWSDELTLAPGLGFDHLSIQPDIPGSSSTSEGALIPRLRFGWRHLLGPQVAIDFALDAGYTKLSTYDSFPFDTSAPDTVFLGLDVAMHWGL